MREIVEWLAIGVVVLVVVVLVVVVFIGRLRKVIDEYDERGMR